MVYNDVKYEFKLKVIRLFAYTYCPQCGQPLKKRLCSRRLRKYCPACDFVHYVNPLPAAVAIAEQGSELLLIKRSLPPGEGLWTFPSGFMEAGETPEKACLRELKEETGMVGEIQKLVGIYHAYSQIYGDVLNLCYQVKLVAGTLTAGDDAAAVRLVPVSGLRDLGFQSFNRAFKDYLASLGHLSRKNPSS